MEDGYDDSDSIVESLVRLHGVSPDEVLVEKERRKECLEALKVILDCLNDKQKTMLLMRAQGSTLQEIAKETGTSFQNMTRDFLNISNLFDKFADEGKINALNEKIQKYYSKKTLSENKQRLLREAEEELDKRMAVREALKALIVLLEAPVSEREMNGSVSTPSYPFEWEMRVNMGMEYRKQGANHTYHYVTKTACHMPDYLDKKACCTICAACRRKDNPGRTKKGRLCEQSNV